MSVAEIVRRAKPNVWHAYIFLTVVLAASIIWQPRFVLETAQFVISGMVQVAPLVIPGVLLAAWIIASGASDHVAAIFRGRTSQAVLGAAVVGALLPLCGVTVLPLMAGLLASGVPLAPVMAFWLASPITGPELVLATAATLGLGFAIGKALAAIGLGLFGGGMTALFANRAWAVAPLRFNRIVGSLGASDSTCGPGLENFDARIWREPARRERFLRQCWSITRLILLVLTPAFAAEFLLNSWLAPNALAAFVGQESAFAIPLAVVVGGPAYLDGYAALPLTRALMEHGMAPGAAMAFLVSGGVVSIWGAMAIFPILKLKPFLLYLALAAAGSMIAGWAFGWLY